ncbi:MAG: protein kinase [Planctomycetota bacterium]
MKSNSQDKDILTGKVFGACRLIKKIGEGGMGVVYLAHHLALNKNVAVKILPPSFAQEDERVKRFIREARSAAQLEHSNIVQIYNVAKQDDYYFIIMQYVDGESLAGKIRREGKINLSEALRIVNDVAVALSVAHHKGIIHRDIKPENIMITKNDEIKLMDFGLARVLDVASHLSRTGDILGTPYYLSPEQAKGLKVDGRADIYALGITLYYMISGKRPFDGDSTVSIILKHINEKPPPIREFNPEIPESVSLIINKMMEKDAMNRYQSTEELINDIDRCSNEIATVNGARLPERTSSVSRQAGEASIRTVISSTHNVKNTRKIINKKMIITAAVLAIVIIFIVSIIRKNKQPSISQAKSNSADNGQVSPEQKREYLKDKLLERCNECYKYFVDKNYEKIKPYFYISKDKNIPARLPVRTDVHPGGDTRSGGDEEKVNRFLGDLKRLHEFYESRGGKITVFKIRDNDIKIQEPAIDFPFVNVEIEVVFSFHNPNQPSRFKDVVISQKNIWVLDDGIWYLYMVPKNADSDEDNLRKKPSFDEFTEFLFLTDEQAEKSKAIIQSAHQEVISIFFIPRQDGFNVPNEINSIKNSQMNPRGKELKISRILSLEIPGTKTTYLQKLTQIKSNIEAKFKGIFSEEQFSKYKQKDIDPLEIQMK